MRLIGAQIDVTDVWRTLENFGSELVKIWQNLTKFDRVASKFSNRSFPQYNLDGPKSCQILSNFFWCLSNFYMSFLIFSRCCQIPVLAFNGRFELQIRIRPLRNGDTPIILQIGAQIDVTGLSRIMENFGNRHEKVHRNMADFNRRSRKKSRSVFQAYNMDCVKFCHIPP